MIGNHIILPADEPRLKQRQVCWSAYKCKRHKANHARALVAQIGPTWLYGLYPGTFSSSHKVNVRCQLFFSFDAYKFLHGATAQQELVELSSLEL
jgi:hypothetical protein